MGEEHQAPGASRRHVQQRESGIQLLQLHYDEGDEAGKILTVGAVQCAVPGHGVHMGVALDDPKRGHVRVPVSVADVRAIVQFWSQAQKPPRPAPLLEAEVAARAMAGVLKEQCPPGWVFVLALFSIGHGGSVTYLSTAERESAIAGLKELIVKMERGRDDPNEVFRRS